MSFDRERRRDYDRVVKGMGTLLLPKNPFRPRDRGRGMSSNPPVHHKVNEGGRQGRSASPRESRKGSSVAEGSLRRGGPEGSGGTRIFERRPAEQQQKRKPVEEKVTSRRNSIPVPSKKVDERQVPKSGTKICPNGNGGRRHSSGGVPVAKVTGRPHDALTVSPSYVAKIYGMDDHTASNFWLRKSTPPASVSPTVFPVGHPNNFRFQTVWSATDREKSYWASRDLTYDIVTKAGVKVADNGKLWNIQHQHVHYSDVYTVFIGNHSSVVKSMFPEDKFEYLDDVGEQYGPCFWIRFTESYGSSIARIIVEECSPSPDSQNELQTVANSKPLALIVSGSNFQGSACLVAAQYLTSFGYSVYLYPVKSNEPHPFPFSSPEDVSYEDIFLVDDLKVLKDVTFDVVVVGVDDYTTPMSTIHLYKDWINCAQMTVLVDPPMTTGSYSLLMKRIWESVEYNSGSREVIIVNAIRPAPYCNGELAKVYVVNYPTSQLLRPLSSAPYVRVHPGKMN